MSFKDSMTNSVYLAQRDISFFPTSVSCIKYASLLGDFENNIDSVMANAAKYVTSMSLRVHMYCLFIR